MNFSRTSFSLGEKILIAKRLSHLLESGLPIPHSIEILAEQARPVHKKSFLLARDMLLHGQRFSSACAEVKGLFSPSMIELLRAGEDTAGLSRSLKEIGREFEQAKRSRDRLIGAMLYPSIILLGTAVLSSFLLFFIFPKVESVFKSLHAGLPLSTRIVLSFSRTVRTYGLYIFGGGAACVVALVYLFRRNKRMNEWLDSFFLSVPLLSKAVSYHIFTKTFRMLDSLLEASVPIERALGYIVQSTGNNEYKKVFADVAAAVARGSSLGTELKKYPARFPLAIIHLIEVSEKTGSLPQTCTYISDLYEQESEHLMKTLGTLVEPLLMVLMGLIVGFIALSLIAPMYGITQNLTR